MILERAPIIKLKYIAFMVFGSLAFISSLLVFIFQMSIFTLFRCLPIAQIWFCRPLPACITIPMMRSLKFEYSRVV